MDENHQEKTQAETEALQRLAKRYLKKDGTVDTYEIISDIYFRKLSKLDVELLLTDPRFGAAFQGKGFIKHPQEYLDNMQNDGIHGKMSRQRHCGEEWIPLPRSQWTKENFDNVWFDFGCSELEKDISKEVLLYFAEMADVISPKKQEDIFGKWGIKESLVAFGITIVAILLATCIFFMPNFSVSKWNMAAYIGMYGSLSYVAYQIVNALRK